MPFRCSESVAARSQRGHRLEDQAVFVAVEIGRGDQFHDPVPGLVHQHQAAEQGLLGLDGVRRDLQAADVQHGARIPCRLER